MGKKPYKQRDTFTRKAKSQGYEARSVFKLEAIADKAPILRRGARVVDLGCYPGSWTRYALEQVGDEGMVVGVDFTAPTVSGAVFLEASALDVPPEQLLDCLGGPADTVLSDMAPKTTGDRTTDMFRSEELTRRALGFATTVLRPGGHFCAKVFVGGGFKQLLADVGQSFAEGKPIHPKNTRSGSYEQYIVARGLKGSAQTRSPSDGDSDNA